MFILSLVVYRKITLLIYFHKECFTLQINIWVRVFIILLIEILCIIVDELSDSRYLSIIIPISHFTVEDKRTDCYKCTPLIKHMSRGHQNANWGIKHSSPLDESYMVYIFYCISMLHSSITFYFRVDKNASHIKYTFSPWC